MNEYLIKQFISSLTIESGIKFAKKYNITFTTEEANYIVPFLKRNVNYINKDNKARLLTMIKKDVSLTTYNKVIALLDKLIK